MIQYSQHELDAKIYLFMKKKMHQFPQLNNEPYYLESAESIKPVEKHLISMKRSRLFKGTPSAHMPLGAAA
jgi:hypothetical protein